MTNDKLAQTTKLQQIASDPKNSSWVFASAGSGKTKVLIDRVLRLLLNGVSTDKILCLTFTKVAATEMQNRIKSELAKWVLFDEDELRKNLLNLNGGKPSKKDLVKARILFAETLDAESAIKIQTIHSFCQSLIKIFPFEAGVKPNFEILEDIEEKFLLQKAQKEVLKKSINDLDLKNIVTEINANLGEESFFELVSELISKKEKLSILKNDYFGIDGIIDEIFNKFLVNKNDNAEKIFRKFINSIDEKKVLKLASALEETNLTSNKEIAKKIRNFLQNQFLENCEIYQLAFFTEKKEIRKINGKLLENPDLANIAQSQINLIRDFFEQLNSYKICQSSSLLLKFVDQILQFYNQLKEQNSFLDYNDLIVETNKLLANPNFANWVKMKLDGLFDHILIDESQDTNHQQWNIIKQLTEDFFSGDSAANKNRTIFIVGDEKQSIYSFQGAEANISEEIFSYFSEKLKNYPTPFHKIDLNNSFRSLPIILEAVDLTFKNAKEKSAISKISDFKGHQAIRQGFGYFEVWPQIKSKKEEKIKSEEINYEWKIDLTPQEKYSEQEFLAEIIALKIKNWIESKTILKGRNNPLKYNDIMILLRRKTDGFDKTLANFFNQYKIPFGGNSKIKFLDNLIIQDLLAAAKFAVASHDDLNLAALLKSPIFAFSEDDLFEVCQIRNRQNITIYKALQQLEKFSVTSNYLSELQKKSLQLSCFEFFYFLLSEKNKEKIIDDFGFEAKEIINKFLLKVFDFCENFSPNLQKFLEFVRKLNPEISLATAKNNQVLISTIHSAKGLQAPIVILPDCCFDTNKLRSTKERVSWINDLPIWCATKNEENNLVKIARAEKKQHAIDENLRLLYVAMTRAEDELYIAGSGNSKDEESWYNLIKRSIAEKSCKKNFSEEINQKFFNEKISKNNFEVTDEVFSLGKRELNLSFSENKITDQQLNSSRVSSTCGNDFPTKHSAARVAFPYPEEIKDLNFDFNQFKKIDNNFLSQQKISQESLAKTQNPSNINSKSQIEGKIIHKILEIFGKNNAEDKKWLIKISEKILDREEFLTKKEKDKISKKIFDFVNSDLFFELFNNEIKCEFEIIGNIDEKKILGRIDLLVEKEKEVLIVDYKSDETLPENTPKHYIDQLITYQKLVENLYPNKKISLAILWMKFLKLEKISSSVNTRQIIYCSN